MTDTGSGADPRGSSPNSPQQWESSLSDSSLSNQPSADPPNPFSREAVQPGDAPGAQPSPAPSAGPESFDIYPPSATSGPYDPRSPYPGPYPAAQPYPASDPKPTGPPPPGFDPQPTPPYGSDVSSSPYGSPTPAYGTNPYEYTPYQPAYGGTSPYSMVQISHPKAGTAMVFGILGVVFGLSCGIGGLLGIPGIVQGRKARDEIDAEPGRYSGRSQAVAGIVTGTIGVVIAALVIVLLVVLLILGATGQL
jgi:hypothetical protein